MVLSASQAVNLTNNVTAFKKKQKVQQELGLVEARIRNASGLNFYSLVYNANIVDNPIADPLVDANLTDIQIEFRDVLLDAGYEVLRDNNTGYWYISWEQQGIEQLVSVYIIYTTVTPGSAESGTRTAIDTYFENVSPVVRSRVTIFTPNGGDLDETAIGADESEFYQYVVVTDQPNDEDHSAGLKTGLTAAGIGYTTDNVMVYKVA